MRGNLSTSLLEGFTCSDAAQSDCENRTVVWKLLEKRHAGSWLSRLPLTKNWKIAGTFSQEHCSVFVGRWLQCSPAAPCWIGKSSSWLKKRVSRNETAKPSLRSFTSFQMIHTHTHRSSRSSCLEPTPSGMSLRVLKSLHPDFEAFGGYDCRTLRVWLYEPRYGLIFHKTTKRFCFGVPEKAQERCLA